MNRRDFVAAGAGLAVGGGLLAAQGNSPTRPNLLVIMTDQQRFDALSMAGNTILETPNMDRIGTEGVYFENCYTQCPVCGPARSSLMIGRTIENSRVRTNMDADEADLIPMPCYDELLADQGYADIEDIDRGFMRRWAGRSGTTMPLPPPEETSGSAGRGWRRCIVAI